MVKLESEIKNQGESWERGTTSWMDILWNWVKLVYHSNRRSFRIREKIYILKTLNRTVWLHWFEQEKKIIKIFQNTFGLRLSENKSGFESFSYWKDLFCILQEVREENRLMNSDSCYTRNTAFLIHFSQHDSDKNSK